MLPFHNDSKVEVEYKGVSHLFKPLVNHDNSIILGQPNNSVETMTYNTQDNSWSIVNFEKDEHIVKTNIKLIDLPVELLENIFKRTYKESKDLKGSRLLNTKLRDTIRPRDLCLTSQEQLEKCLIKFTDLGDLETVKFLVEKWCYKIKSSITRRIY